MDVLFLLQWLAAIATVVAAWLVASRRTRRRHMGFQLFLVSNLLWILWGSYANAYAFVVLQVCLTIMNIRGANKTSDGAVRRERRPHGAG